MQSALKRKLVVGLTGAAVAAFAGGAYAATQTSGPDSRQAFLNDVAKRLHVTPQQLSEALNGAASDQLQAEVAAGRLTQAEANQLEQRLKQNGAPVLPLGPFGFGPRRLLPLGPFGFGPRRLLPLGPFGFGPRRLLPPHLLFAPAPFSAGPGALTAAATYLGLSSPQLFRQLQSGKSLAQIATAKGKSVSGLEQAMTAAVKARLDKLVANKVITQAQEQQELSRFSAQLGQEVNQKEPDFRPNGIPLPHLRFPVYPPNSAVPPPAAPQPAWPSAPGGSSAAPSAPGGSSAAPSA